MNVKSSRVGPNIFGLFGAGGFAREVMPIAREMTSSFNQVSENIEELVFVDVDSSAKLRNGYRVISEDEFAASSSHRRFFNVAISDYVLRKKIAESRIAYGEIPLSLISRNAVVYDGNSIGEGAIICAFSTITSNAKVGKFFHSNIYSYVAHDCVIGDYVTFAPNVHCNGNVVIEDHAYIGTGAIIKQGSPDKPTVIGTGAIIGMGAVVTRDVAPYSTVVGNPARKFEKAG